MKNESPSPGIEHVIAAIVSVRSQRVILDADLAALYGATTKQFNRAVRRNLYSFPADFMFQLTAEEAAALRSQNVTSKIGRGGRRYAPLAFTEHGAIMAATILSTPKAREVSVYVVRAFVRFRETLAAHDELAARLTQLEDRLAKKLAGHDHAIEEILRALRALTIPPSPPRRPIGFVIPKET